MKQINQLPEHTEPNDDDILPIQVNGITKYIKLSSLTDYFGSSSSNPAVFARWRVRNTSLPGGSDGQWIIYELSFRGANMEVLNNSGTPFSFPFSASLSNAFDGTTGTICTVGAKQLDMHIGYQFLAPIKPSFLVIAHLNNPWNIPPLNYILEKSSDGVNWIAHQTFTLSQNDGTYTVTVV